MSRAILICALLLAGCVAGGGTIPLGGETSAHPGWTAYCARHPERIECR